MKAGIDGSPYLTLAEAATWYRFPNARAFREFLRRQCIPVIRVGKKLLIDRRVFDAALEIDTLRA